MSKKLSKKRIEFIIQNNKGCVFNGELNEYQIGEALQKFAIKYGWNGTYTTAASEEYTDNVYNAFDWLNDNALPGEYIFVLGNNLKVERVNY